MEELCIRSGDGEDSGTMHGCERFARIEGIFFKGEIRGEETGNVTERSEDDE